MVVFDDWAKNIVDVLKSESDLAGILLKHGGELGDAREALIRGILERILPSIYEVGTGEVIDSIGKHSRQIDIVIARRDYPSLILPNRSKLYLVESVLATIEVKSFLDKDLLIGALENCASVADLSPNVKANTIKALAKTMELEEITSGNFMHKDPLVTARFDLIPRPVSYVFAFRGYKESIDDFLQAINQWGQEREQSKNFAMRHIPAVVAAEGCVAWRNAEPYYFKDKNFLCLIGIDKTPLRLLVLHLLYTLNKKVPPIADAYGIQSNLDVYIQQMSPPSFSKALFKAINKEVKY
jgi:hypothetical protein